jgi:hypothetical protein
MSRAYWSSPKRREIASFRVQRNEMWLNKEGLPLGLPVHSMLG